MSPTTTPRASNPKAASIAYLSSYLLERNPRRWPWRTPTEVEVIMAGTPGARPPLSTRPSESIDNKNTDPHELVVRHEAQLGIGYSSVCAWEAIASSRRTSFSASIVNHLCR